MAPDNEDTIFTASDRIKQLNDIDRVSSDTDYVVNTS